MNGQSFKISITAGGMTQRQCLASSIYAHLRSLLQWVIVINQHIARKLLPANGGFLESMKKGSWCEFVSKGRTSVMLNEAGLRLDCAHIIIVARLLQQKNKVCVTYLPNAETT
eukprot:scaffold23271_cov36-Prasinocladus_malaysianus.AAC.1